MTVRSIFVALAGSALTFVAAPAFAQDTPAEAEATPAEQQPAPQREEVRLALLDTSKIATRGPSVPEQLKSPATDLSFTLAGISDYRYRGVSLSNGKPAVQAELALQHESGLFASAWASTLPQSNGFGSVELEATLGFSKEIGGLTLEAGGMGYFYPGKGNVSYFELQAGASTKIGKAEVSANVAYAPRQSNIGGQDNVYGAVGVDLPWKDTPLTLSGSIGVEDGAFGNTKLDWSLGATYTVMGIDLGVTYVDSARTFGAAHSGPKLLMSVGRKF